MGALHDRFDRRAAVAMLDEQRRTLRIGAVLVTPLEQGDEDRVEIAALVGEPVLVARAAAFLAVGDGVEDPGLDEGAQSGGQHGGGQLWIPKSV